MNKSVLFIAVVLAAGCTKPPAVEKADSPELATAKLSNDMVGVWVYAGTPGQISPISSPGERFKFRTGNHWVLTRADPETGLVEEHFGGTYTLNGDEYVETQDYGDERWQKDNGKSFRFKVKVEGDTMIQLGIGNPYNEVWKRASSDSQQEK